MFVPLYALYVIANSGMIQYNIKILLTMFFFHVNFGQSDVKMDPAPGILYLDPDPGAWRVRFVS